jgi:alpha 1,3-mannosyltransferase
MKKPFLILSIFSSVCILLFLFFIPRPVSIPAPLPEHLEPEIPIDWQPERVTPEGIRETIITDSTPYIGKIPSDADFGELGERTQKLYGWLTTADEVEPHLTSSQASSLREHLESVIVSSYPYLKNPKESSPFTKLRNNIVPNSKGIVIAAGQNHFRYLTHLLLNIHSVLKSELPVQIVYAGDDDLPKKYRDTLTELFPFVETVDIYSYFNDELIDFAHGTWAIKPFAILASKFEQIICIDADAVFLQKPEALLEQSGYSTRGALFFHDRLLWQNVFKDRAKWWRSQMDAAHRQPSDTLRKSKVWMEGYAEEGDSGVIVLDKARMPIFMGLLHIAWQNSKGPRDAFTYKQTYGDKESWWFGMELSAVPYSFERYYGSMLGTTETRHGQEMVCSFSIAHLDDNDKLIWFNGSLLKNKSVNLVDFLLPDAWMVNGEWIKGGSKQESSCMKSSQIRTVSNDDSKVLKDSIAEAELIDTKLIEMGFDLKITTGMRGG